MSLLTGRECYGTIQGVSKDMNVTKGAAWSSLSSKTFRHIEPASALLSMPPGSCNPGFLCPAHDDACRRGLLFPVGPVRCAVTTSKRLGPELQFLRRPPSKFRLLLFELLGPALFSRR
jgi:hypothetical protein